MAPRIRHVPHRDRPFRGLTALSSQFERCGWRPVSEIVGDEDCEAERIDRLSRLLHLVQTPPLPGTDVVGLAGLGRVDRFRVHDGHEVLLDLPGCLASDRVVLGADRQLGTDLHVDHPEFFVKFSVGRVEVGFSRLQRPAGHRPKAPIFLVSQEKDSVVTVQDDDAGCLAKAWCGHASILTESAVGRGRSRRAAAGFGRPCPCGLDVHLVCDNYATHNTAEIKTWLGKHPRFHVHFTPTGSSWINQVERWFGLLTDKLIRRGVHTSVKALEDDIKAWIATWNEDPKPFTWTKTADEILNSLADYLAKIAPPGTEN